MHEPTTPDLDSPPLHRYGYPSLERRPSPAAGAHFVEGISGAFYVRLISFFCRVVTDANVASRTVVLEYRDDTDLRFVMAGAPVTQAASTTSDYAFQAWLGQPDWSVDDTVLAPLVPLLLLPTWDFRLYLDNVQAGDQISQVRFVWERFYTGAPPG